MMAAMRRLGFAALVLFGLLWGGNAFAADDPGAPLQWGMVRIGAETAWAGGQGEGITIAIIDTGVDLDHEDLVGRIVAGRDLVDDDDVADDEEGHGTHVAGVAAASSGNGLGVIGVAPKASIMPVRVLDGAGRGTLEDVAAGIRWATEHGADVINLSLGPERGDLTPHPTSDAALRDSIDQAWAAGIVVVLAAGNDEALELSHDSPAIVVAATTKSDAAARYATDADNDLAGAPFALAAPGGEVGDTTETCAADPAGILSTYRQEGVSGSYACLAGTSMAAPHVAGAAAVLRGLGLDNGATRSRLLATAVDLGPPGPDPVFGAGRLDVAAAVAGMTGGSVPPGPTAPTTPTTVANGAVASTSAVPGTVPRTTPTAAGGGLARVGPAPAPAITIDGVALGAGGDDIDRTVPLALAGALVLVVGAAAVRLRAPGRRR